MSEITPVRISGVSLDDDQKEQPEVSHATQDHASPAGKRLALIGLALVVGVYLVFAIAISEVTPFNKGPDEGINLDYIQFIAANGRLPITYDERSIVGPKANWPALYHLLVVGLGNLFGVDVEQPPHIKIFWDSFRYRAIDVQAENPWYLLTEDQSWPYYNSILVLHLGRWLSVFFSVATLLLIYFITLEILPHRPDIALAAAALGGFIPTYMFIGSVLNEDAVVAFLATFYFWMLVLAVKQPETLWPYWVMGTVLGLSVTVKYTTVILPLEVLGVIGWIAWRHRYSWLWWLKRIAIVGGTSIVASSWWFGWNFWYLNEIETLGLIPGLLRPLLTGGTDVTMARLGNIFTGGQIGLAELPQDVQVGTFSGWVRSTFFSFWGVGIGDSIPLYPYAYLVVGIVMLTAGFGLWRLWQMERAARGWLFLFLAHVTIFFIAPLIRFGLSRRLGQTAQGRHILIPAVAAIAILLVWGIATAIPRRWQRSLLALLVIAFIGWTAAHVYKLATFASPLLPLRTVTEAAAWLPNPIQTKFGEAVELVSYDIDPLPESGELHLELGWRSLGYVNESYLLQVTVLDTADNVVSHWLGHHGQGRVPTLAWDPGDAVFDRLMLPLPDAPAGTYEVRVQLLGRAGPLAVEQRSGGAERQGSEQNTALHSLSLATFTLDRSTSLTFAGSVAFGNGEADTGNITFDLWRANGPAEPISNPQSPNLPIPQSPHPPISHLPTYRYPGTITLLTRPGVQAELIGPAGQVWPATDSANGIHHFVIGPRWLSGAYQGRLSLPEVEDDIEQATTEPLLTVENWWERRFEKPDIAVPLEANFANQLKFLGYKLPQEQVKAGQSFPVTLYWQAPADKSPDAEFIQFNQLLDSNGTLWGGYDRQPLEYYNTLLWAPGEIVVDGYAVPVDPEAPPGQYYLNVGYYLTVGESAVNLPLVVDGQMSEQSSVTIGPIDVVSP